ncbi:hypothetical protein KR200_006428 [Drosophila serrata]|nr:hypothetical protein KR200_006428 [Drosophila serrata]
MAATASVPARQREPKIPAPVRKISRDGARSSVSTNPAVPKSPDGLTSLVGRKSITSMSDEEIIQENLNEILDLKSREERKANGRLVAVIVCFLVLFLAVYHACVRKTENSLAGVLVPAGIMLSYGAWVVILAKRDKRRQAMFERHIEEVTLKNKTEIEEHHARHQAKMLAQQTGHSTTGTDSTGSASSTLHYVNELMPIGEHRKKQRRHRHRERDERPGEREREKERERERDRDRERFRDRERQHPSTMEIGVHRLPAKRPSIRQKLFGQSIVHKKLVEAQSDSADSTGPGPGPGSGRSPGHSSNPADKRQKLQRMDTLALPQVIRTSSAP